MLNYIWLGLIIAGILVAAGNDIRDELNNTYRNGVPLEATLEVQKTPSALRQTWEGTLVVDPQSFNAFYGASRLTQPVRQPAVLSTAPDGRTSVSLPVADSTPDVWKAMAGSSPGKDRLSGNITAIKFSDDGKSAAVRLVLEPVRWVKMKAITQAALEYAALAVTISLGLIGVMALWLGVMKVAEQAGVLRLVTRALLPLTRRLFPDVPPDHPAVAAMMMNIAANMLGLSNAATPLGLKAMEELNKLNPKLGTATNAMCTFLAINTGGLVFIPATALAVRAAVGSANPGVIIGTSIVGGTCATIAGITAAKLLQRLPRYRRALEVSHG